jgi:hypothetical protein
MDKKSFFVDHHLQAFHFHRSAALRRHHSHHIQTEACVFAARLRRARPSSGTTERPCLSHPVPFYRVDIFENVAGALLFIKKKARIEP